MKKTTLALTFCAALLSSHLMAQTLITVNNTKIDSSEVDRRVKILLENKAIQSDIPQIRQQLLHELVTNTLLAQEARRLKLDKTTRYQEAIKMAQDNAKRNGIDKKADYKARFADFQNDLLAQAYIAHIVESKPISEAEIQKTYDEFKTRYQGTDEIQIGQIVTNKSEDAEKALKDLNSKKSFIETAKKYSIDPAVKQTNGIEQVYTPLKDLSENATRIYEVLKDLKKGQHARKVISGNGFYAIFYVNDKRKIAIPAFDEVKANIANELNGERIDAAIGELYKKANIVPAK